MTSYEIPTDAAPTTPTGPTEETFAELPVEEFELENKVGHEPLAFTGVLLSEASTRIDTPEFQSPRWTEMGLYCVTQGPNKGLYVLEIIGASDVYHLTGVACTGSKYGKWVAPSDLDDEAVPCPKCDPPSQGDDRPMPPLLAVENDFPQLYQCPTPQDVINQLRSGGNGSMSSPAQRLVVDASEVDPGIYRALHAPRRL